MSLLQIEKRLLENASQIARTEHAFGERRSRALESSLKSLYKVRAYLEQEFNEATSVAQVDVISYRIFDAPRPTMSLLGRAMDSLQTLYAIVYSAISSGLPRDTSRLSSANIEASSFQFSYAFSGSTGLVFTIPNDRLLLGETKLDEAMNSLLELITASSTEEIRKFAMKFGLASVRAAYVWASAISSSKAGVEIEWKKNALVKSDTILQPAQIEALKNLIDLTSDEEIDENTFVGVLLAFDSVSRSFRFDPQDGGNLIRGTLADDAKFPIPVRIPNKYKAKIKTLTKIKYATDQPEKSNELLWLEEFKD